MAKYFSKPDKFFLINMQHYLKASHTRLIKIKPLNMLPWYRFKPTQKWSSKFKKTFTLPIDNGMFHYSLLTNPNIRSVFWRNQYKNNKQIHKTRWLNEIYRNYDLSNENYWVKKDSKLSGIKSPWFNEGMKPDKNSRLFKYEGKHPKFIEETHLHKVIDFREYYNFK